MSIARRLFVLVPILVGGLLLAAGWLALAQPPAAKKVALLVGVNEYDKRGLAEDPLKFAERDVEEMAKVLKADGYDVRLLTGSARGADRASLANLQIALATTLKDRNANDLVLIALAGHGMQLSVKVGETTRDESYFCPVDAARDDPTTLFSLSGLIDQLDRKGGINLVLVDACRNDPTPGRGRGVNGGKVTQLPPRTAVLFSCSARQKAYETEKAGGGHGVFFHAVLEALGSKSVANDRGEVTWGRLAEYVQDKVPGYAAEWIEEAKLKGQAPHEVKNLNVARPPVLVALKGGGSRADIPKADIGSVQPSAGDKTLTVDLGGGVKMEFVRIPAGEFWMGSPDSDKDADIDEKPRHQVRITKAFYLGRTTVTKGQFAAFVSAEGYRTEAERDGEGGNGWNADENKFEGRKPQYTWKNTGWAQSDEHPVVNVTHDDAMKFCAWLEKKQPSFQPTLPTEAQWEYACRGGTTTRYFTGDAPDSLEGFGNFADETLRKKLNRAFDAKKWFAFDDRHPFTCPVGTYKPNGLGLYDMNGNVWQWCLDGPRTYRNQLETDPVGPTAGGSDRVYRGGSWDSFPRDCRSALRRRDVPSDRVNALGFRLALVPSGS